MEARVILQPQTSVITDGRTFYMGRAGAWSCAGISLFICYLFLARMLGCFEYSYARANGMPGPTGRVRVVMTVV